MAVDRVSDLLLVIKHQMASQELLFEYLVKVEAMVEIILSKDLTDFSNEKLHNYLWCVSDLIVKAKELNEKLMDTLDKVTPLLNQSEAATFNRY
jgi:hypothetical protein